MAERLEQRETVKVEELVLAQAYEIAALVELLEEKGIITRAEMLDRIGRLRRKASKR